MTHIVNFFISKGLSKNLGGDQGHLVEQFLALEFFLFRPSITEIEGKINTQLIY